MSKQLLNTKTRSKLQQAIDKLDNATRRYADQNAQLRQLLNIGAVPLNELVILESRKGLRTFVHMPNAERFTVIARADSCFAGHCAIEMSKTDEQLPLTKYTYSRSISTLGDLLIPVFVEEPS